MNSIGGLRRPPGAPGNGAGAQPENPAEAGLGKLVQFDRRERNPKARPDHSGTAEIVIFTGVRYERDSAPLPDKPLGSPARAKRRRG